MKSFHIIVSFFVKVKTILQKTVGCGMIFSEGVIDMTIFCDMHTHSHHSFDAKSSVDEMCRAAIERGLEALAVTDHCEAPFIRFGADCEFGCFDELIPQSFADATAARERYAGRLKVLRGLELGEPTHDRAATVHALAYGDFDFVLASVHNIRNMQDFYYMNYSGVDVDGLLARYFDELCETASFEHFDSLSHLTYPLRYIVAGTGRFPDLSVHADAIDTIFKILIKNQKALEINVSGLFKELKTTLPDVTLVRRFRELGGQYITIGTDAHSADMVGRGIGEGIAVAKEAGFSQYVIYEKHRPIKIDINEE